MPAVLTENLFIDVASDAARLKRQEVIDALIDGHVQGIATYLGLTAKKANPPKTGVTAVVNGKTIEGAVLSNGTVLIPLRAAGDNIKGAKIGWDQKSMTATLDTP
ncbi:hypothetical protein D3C71_1081920 [compost metagenome]